MEEKCRGTKAGINLEEFALHLGRIGGVTALAANGKEPVVIQREGMESSNTFLTYVRANMEDAWWISTSLVRKSYEWNGHSEQGYLRARRRAQRGDGRGIGAQP